MCYPHRSVVYLDLVLSHIETSDIELAKMGWKKKAEIVLYVTWIIIFYGLIFFWHSLLGGDSDEPWLNLIIPEIARQLKLSEINAQK